MVTPSPFDHDTCTHFVTANKILQWWRLPEEWQKTLQEDGRSIFQVDKLSEINKKMCVHVFTQQDW